MLVAQRRRELLAKGRGVVVREFEKVPVSGERVRAGGDQQLHDFHIAVRARQQKRMVFTSVHVRAGGAPVLLGSRFWNLVGRCAGGKQPPHDLDVAFHARAAQRLVVGLMHVPRTDMNPGIATTRALSSTHENTPTPYRPLAPTLSIRPYGQLAPSTLFL